MKYFFKELKTERLNLRQVQQEDAPFILKFFKDDEATKFMLHHYYTLAEVQEQMDYYHLQHKNKSGMYWLIENKLTQEKYGVAGFHNFSLQNHKAEIGYWLLPKYEKQGFTFEALSAIFNYSFYELEMNRIEATIETENQSSIKLAYKLN